MYGAVPTVVVMTCLISTCMALPLTFTTVNIALRVGVIAMLQYLSCIVTSEDLRYFANIMIFKPDMNTRFVTRKTTKNGRTRNRRF
jgi:hypothetical protein